MAYADMLSQCAGKHAFVSAALANKVARKMKGLAKAYRCPDCGKWHIGHPLPSRLRRKPQEAQL